MRKAACILLLILLYLLFTAKSCDNEEQSDAARDEARAKASQDSIAAVFESDTLSEEALSAFEETAGLKIYDLAEYLKILADSNTEEGFKVKVEGMIREMFLPENGNMNYSNAGIKKLNLQTGVVIDSVNIQKSLQPVNDSLYSGQLQCFLRRSHPLNHDERSLKVENRVIEIFVAKREKNFGNNTLKVWTVLLGEIK